MAKHTQKKKKGKREASLRKIDYHKLSVYAAIAILLLLFFRTHALGFFQDQHGPETVKHQQHTVPQDVKDAIDKQRKLNSLTEIPVYRVPILMYHYIEHVTDVNDKTRILLNIQPHIFDEQVKTLKEAGFTFLRNDELTQILDGTKTLPEKPILLTFDDGYRDFYTEAYPILKKYNAAGTQYVITALLDHPNHLTTDQVKELAQDSLIEIGGHTVSHDWLKDKTPEEVRFQVTDSRRILEKLSGKKVVSFAYPYGAFDLSATKVVEDSGYTSAVSTVPGIKHSTENRYFLYRLRPGERVGEELLNWLSNDHFSAF